MNNLQTLTVTENEYLGRKGYEISDSLKRIFITNEVGGRVLYYGPHDFNILYEVNKSDIAVDVDLSNKKNGAEIKNSRLDYGWINYGGYKTWIAPQEKWEGPPYLDLDSGEYEMSYYEKSNGDIFLVQVSPICRETGLQIKREFNIECNTTAMTITHKLYQRDEKFDFRGIWDVTQVKKPCKAFLEGTVVKFEEFNGKVQLSDYILFDKDNNTTICECPENDTKGYKAYFIAKKGGILTEFNLGNRKVLYNKTFKSEPTLRYAHDSNIEVYSDANKNYAEIEVHSPLFTFTKECKKTYFNIKWDFTII